MVGPVLCHHHHRQLSHLNFKAICELNGNKTAGFLHNRLAWAALSNCLKKDVRALGHHNTHTSTEIILWASHLDTIAYNMVLLMARALGLSGFTALINQTRKWTSFQPKPWPCSHFSFWPLFVTTFSFPKLSISRKNVTCSFQRAYAQQILVLVMQTSAIFVLNRVYSSLCIAIQSWG